MKLIAQVVNNEQGTGAWCIKSFISLQAPNVFIRRADAGSRNDTRLCGRAQLRQLFFCFVFSKHAAGEENWPSKPAVLSAGFRCGAGITKKPNKARAQTNKVLFIFQHIRQPNICAVLHNINKCIVKLWRKNKKADWQTRQVRVHFKMVSRSVKTFSQKCVPSVFTQLHVSQIPDTTFGELFPSHTLR